MADIITNSKATAPTAAAPAKPTAPTAAPVAKPVLKLSFNRSKYQGLKLARLRLLQSGIIQYDPQNSELVLDTTAPEGKILPLTAFFSGRLGKTVELVKLIEE